MAPTRSTLHHQKQIEVLRTGQEVTFVFPKPEDEVLRTRIVIPTGSSWSPSPHWHERYTEYFRVVQGRVAFVLEDQHRVIDADSAVQIVEKGRVHNFWRADVDDGEDVIVEEWTDPSDGVKEVFFRNLFGVIQDAPKPLSRLAILQIIQIEVAYDNWPVIVQNARLRRIASHLMQRTGSWVAWALGCSPYYDEYTPERLRRVART